MRCWHTLIIQWTQALVLLVGVDGGRWGRWPLLQLSKARCLVSNLWQHLQVFALLWALNSSDPFGRGRLSSPLVLPPPGVFFLHIGFLSWIICQRHGTRILILYDSFPLMVPFCAVTWRPPSSPVLSSWQMFIEGAFLSLSVAAISHMKTLLTRRTPGCWFIFPSYEEGEHYKGRRKVPMYPGTCSHVLSDDECVYLFTLWMLRDSFQMSDLLSLGHMDSLYLLWVRWKQEEQFYAPVI